LQLGAISELPGALILLASILEDPMRRTLSILVALGLPTAASAQSWVFVADCGEQNQVRTYSYDPKSVARSAGNVVVRLKGDYSRAAASPAKEARIVWSFDCADRTYVERTRIEYGANRKVLTSYTKPTPIMGISRNSIADKVFGKVCA
jgi:hypothetical protein